MVPMIAVYKSSFSDTDLSMYAPTGISNKDLIMRYIADAIPITSIDPLILPVMKIANIGARSWFDDQIKKSDMINILITIFTL